MEFKEININKIEIVDNVRLESRRKDLVGLMEDIKQNGLLQPVGVKKIGKDHFRYIFGYRRIEACKKLGNQRIMAAVMDAEELTETEVMLLNISENLHRKDVSPFELGRVCVTLHKIMTTPEIAARLSLPITRVASAIRLFNLNIPDDEKTKTIFASRPAEKKKGKVPATTMYELFKTNISSEKKKTMLRYIKENELTVKDVRLLTDLVCRGMEIDVAIAEFKKWTVFHYHMIVNKKIFDKLKEKHKCKGSELINQIVKGKIPCEVGLIY